MSVRVLIADDHPVLRTGVASLLAAEPDIELVGEAADGPDCVEKATALAPDVVIIDINMPGGSGLEALDDLRRLVPETKVLVLTMHDDAGYLKHVLASGGSGYILKQAAAEQLISAIRIAVEGGVFIHPHHAQVLALDGDTRSSDSEESQALRDRYDSLSARETEVFKMVVLGHTNAEIASESSLSVKTVETYRARLTKKLGISSRAALVRAAIELGVVS